MTVVNTFVAQVKPGRLEEAVGLCKEAAKVLERLGAHNTRLLRGGSGEFYGALAMSSEYESSEAWGRSYEALMSDDEIISLINRAEGSSSPYASQTVQTASEIPLGGKAYKPGAVMDVYISRPNPGRFQDAVDLATRAARVMAKTGGSSRLFWLGAAGTQSGALVLTTEYKSMAALGKSGDQFLEDPKGQPLLDELLGANAAVTVISQDIFTDIPL